MARGMEQVRLDDVDDGTTTAEVAGPGPRRPWRRTVGVAVAVALLVVAAAATVQRALDDRRTAADEALAARFGDVAGVVAPLGPGLHVRWVTAGDDTGVLLSGVESAGLVVGLRVHDDRAEVVGLDVRDGSPRWSTPLQVPEIDVADLPWGVERAIADRSPDPAFDEQVRRDALDALAAAEVTARGCSTTSGGGVACVLKRVTELGEVTSVVAVDPADGSAVQRTYGLETSVVVAGDLVAVVRGVDAAGSPVRDAAPARWDLETSDALSGETRWTWPGPPPAADELGLPILESVGDAVLLQTSDGRRAFAADGTVLAQEPASDDVSAFVDDRFVPTVAPVTTDDGLLAQESAARLDVDDGSLPDFTLATQQGISGQVVVARDASGTLRWASHDTLRARAVLDGRVLAESRRGVALLDGADGSTLWSFDGARLTERVVTDGRLVLVTSGETVRAVDLASGRTRWEVRVADLGGGVVDGVTARPGLRHVLVRTSDGYAVLG